MRFQVTVVDCFKFASYWVEWTNWKEEWCQWILVVVEKIVSENFATAKCFVWDGLDVHIVSQISWFNLIVSFRYREQFIENNSLQYRNWDSAVKCDFSFCHSLSLCTCRDLQSSGCLADRPSVLKARSIGQKIIAKMKEFVRVFVEGIAA